MTTNPLVPVIDYTSRDYRALRADMIRVIRSRLPQWTADNPADFGVALVEAFAYSQDILHYYLDRVANEAYLDTAMQRESLFSIARMFNYTPRNATPARVDLRFTNASEEEIELPKGTRCQASIQSDTGVIVKNFETNVAAIIPASSTPVPVETLVPATEGRTYTDETIGVSTGFVRQRYLLPQTSVIDGTVSITTTLGDATVEWQELVDISDASPLDTVFQRTVMTDSTSVITFGDGLHGAIPDLHSVIRATYRVGGGTKGNVAPYTVTAVVEPVIFGLSVTNPLAGTGGTNAESLDSIRLNASRSFRSRKRAVTIADFNAVAITADGIAKAKTLGNNGSSVAVYVVPETDANIVSDPPSSTLTQDQRTYVQNYLEDLAMAGVSLSVFPPSWETFYVKMNVYLEAAAYQAQVSERVTSAMAMLYGFEKVGFDQRVTVQDMMRALSDIEGVEYVDIEAISLDPAFTVEPGESPTKALDIGAIAVNAIPYWDEETSLTMTLFGGIEA